MISALEANKWSHITLCSLTNVLTSICERFCPNFEQINISRATPLLLNQLTWQNLLESGLRWKEPKLCMQYWVKPWRSIPRPLIRQARMRFRAQTVICDWRQKKIKVTKGIFNLGLSLWEAQVKRRINVICIKSSVPSSRLIQNDLCTKGDKVYALYSLSHSRLASLVCSKKNNS